MDVILHVGLFYAHKDVQAAGLCGSVREGSGKMGTAAKCQHCDKTQYAAAGMVCSVFFFCKFLENLL